jgi:hypothetical protein
MACCEPYQFYVRANPILSFVGEHGFADIQRSALIHPQQHEEGGMMKTSRIEGLSN